MVKLPALITHSFFMPHGHCYLWQPAIVWLQVVTNLSIGIAYVAISAMLATLVYRIRDLPFKMVYVAFGTFIVSCGITHFFDVIVIWRPIYWWDTGVRTVTALASVGTAFLLPGLLPRARALMEGARAAHRRGIALQTMVADLDVDLKTRSQELAAALDEARAANAEAARLSRGRVDFIHLIAHELGTPLTALRLQVGRLARRTPELPERRRPLVAQLEVSARRISELVASLLQYNRLSTASGQVVVMAEAVSLADLWRQLREEFADVAVAGRISIRDQTEPEGLVVCSDPDLLRMAMSHLLANALKFTPRGGTIALTATQAGDKILLQVSDDGPGIDTHHQAAIFEPFVHLEELRHKHTPGIGLGLPLVRATVRALGGELLLASKVGEGATFTVVLPARAAPTPSPTAFAPGVDAARIAR